MRSGFYKLDAIVREAAMELGGMHMYEKALNGAVRCVRELAMDTMGEYALKRVKLTVENQRAYLPEDYMRYVQLGVVEFGNLVNLARNDRMVSLLDDCGDAQPVDGGNPKRTKFQYDPYAYIANGLNQADYWRVFNGPVGNGGGWSWRGYYEVDEKNGWVDFDSEYSYDYVILDYVTTGFNPGEDNYIHMIFVNTIISYALYWVTMTEARHQTKQRPMIETWRRNYLEEKRRAGLAVMKSPLYEFIDAARKSFGMYPKN